MGTNFYARVNTCKECGRYEEIHIGKSSIGWTFTFHATDKIKSYRDWLYILEMNDVDIYDEYDRKVSLKWFKELVKGKRKSERNHAKDYSEGGSYLDEEGNSMSPYEFS